MAEKKWLYSWGVKKFTYRGYISIFTTSRGKWVAGVTTPLLGVIAPFITCCFGPPRDLVNVWESERELTLVQDTRNAMV